MHIDAVLNNPVVLRLNEMLAERNVQIAKWSQAAKYGRTQDELESILKTLQEREDAKVPINIIDC
jgi:diaminopimelate decarboxylase